MNFHRALGGIWSWFFKPELASDSPGSAENTVSPWRELLKKINATDSLESSLSSGKGFGESVYNTFEHFWKIREYDAVGELLLASLDKVTKERDQLRDEISQLQTRINDLQVSKCVLGETLLSYSHRIEAGEKQTRALILRLADLQAKVECQPHCKVSADKVRALIGKEWDPVTWDGDVWENTDSDVTEEADALPQEHGQQHKTELSQNQASPPLVSRPYTPQELRLIANSNMQKKDERAGQWILRVWDNDGRLALLDQTEFLCLGPLSCDSEFNVIACAVEENRVKSLFDWLAGVWAQRWPPIRKLQMPDSLSWYYVSDGIKILRELGMIEWLCVKATCPQWRGPEDVPITRDMRVHFVRGAYDTHKSFVFSLLCLQGLTVGAAVAQLQDVLVEIHKKPEDKKASGQRLLMLG
uniref:Fv1 restriction factor n=1 Tax=Lophuromys flavopunctatus TaxID=51348 RepID=A0A2Z4LKX8_LOPFL|nr:Fv1 restriction factor [Lophuromys flavopunctatus]